MMRLNVFILTLTGIAIGFFIGYLVKGSCADQVSKQEVPQPVVVNTQHVAFLNGKEVLVEHVDDEVELKPKTFFEQAFNDFKVEVEEVEPVSIDENSHTLARQFKTRITEQCAKGVNFAGQYSLAYWGCGSNCMGSAITDLATGKVYEGPWSAGVRFESNYIDFRPDSRLIIINPPDSSGFYEQGMFTKPQYFVWDNNELVEVKE